MEHMLKEQYLELVLAFGSPVVFESASTNITSATYDSSNNKPVLCYKAGGKGKAGCLIRNCIQAFLCNK